MKEKIGILPPFGLRMPSSIRKWVESKAAEQDRSMNYVITRILEDAMTAAEGAKFGDRTPTAALSNNAAFERGASINNG